MLLAGDDAGLRLPPKLAPIQVSCRFLSTPGICTSVMHLTYFQGKKPK